MSRRGNNVGAVNEQRLRADLQAAARVGGRGARGLQNPQDMQDMRRQNRNVILDNAAPNGGVANVADIRGLLGLGAGNAARLRLAEEEPGAPVVRPEANRVWPVVDAVTQDSVRGLTVVLKEEIRGLVLGEVADGPRARRTSLARNVRIALGLSARAAPVNSVTNCMRLLYSVQRILLLQHRDGHDEANAGIEAEDVAGGAELVANAPVGDAEDIAAARADAAGAEAVEQGGNGNEGANPNCRSPARGSSEVRRSLEHDGRNRSRSSSRYRARRERRREARSRSGSRAAGRGHRGRHRDDRSRSRNRERGERGRSEVRGRGHRGRHRDDRSRSREVERGERDRSEVRGRGHRGRHRDDRSRSREVERGERDRSEVRDRGHRGRHRDDRSRSRERERGERDRSEMRGRGHRERHRDDRSRSRERDAGRARNRRDRARSVGSEDREHYRSRSRSRSWSRRSGERRRHRSRENRRRRHSRHSRSRSRSLDSYSHSSGGADVGSLRRLLNSEKIKPLGEFLFHRGAVGYSRSGRLPRVEGLVLSIQSVTALSTFSVAHVRNLSGLELNSVQLKWFSSFTQQISDSISPTVPTGKH